MIQVGVKFSFDEILIVNLKYMMNFVEENMVQSVTKSLKCMFKRDIVEDENR